MKKTSVLFVFFKKNIYFWVIENWQKKTDMSGIKGVDKKIHTMFENDQEKRKTFYEKNI